VKPLLERYRDRLPLPEGITAVSLGEGATPLLPAPRLSAAFGLDVWLKVEGANPTGSFKDRGMTVAVSAALAEGARGVVCASTGNTAASAAAYAARAGIACTVVHAAGAVAAGKLAQARAAGARVHEVDGDFEAAFAAAGELVRREGSVLVNSVNRLRLEGQKTAAFELVEELGGAPDALLLPYGGGGNTLAYRLGFEEAGEGLPLLHPVQAADRATTRASAIRIGSPVHRADVERAVEASGGGVVTVSEDELAAAWRRLAREEGVLCELASAAAVAGLAAARLDPGARVVCVLTGHGLKDPQAVEP
jgi:threonine synthase